MTHNLLYCSMLEIPENIKRVVIVANVLFPPRFQFRQDDWIIECNRAIHHSKIKALDNHIANSLVVRHNREQHFFPANFLNDSISWDSIYLTGQHCGFSRQPWFADYVQARGKYPTTGYGIYMTIRSQRPDIEIIGLGFSPDDQTSYHNDIHDWDYEYSRYAKDEHFTMISNDRHIYYRNNG